MAKRKNATPPSSNACKPSELEATYDRLQADCDNIAARLLELPVDVRHARGRLILMRYYMHQMTLLTGKPSPPPAASSPEPNNLHPE